MMNFSKLYVESQMIKNMLLSIPEERRDEFTRQLEATMSGYDRLISEEFKNTPLYHVLAGQEQEIPNQGTVRPPRRR